MSAEGKIEPKVHHCKHCPGLIECGDASDDFICQGPEDTECHGYGFERLAWSGPPLAVNQPERWCGECHLGFKPDASRCKACSGTGQRERAEGES